MRWGSRSARWTRARGWSIAALQARGGLQAGLGFAGACMGGLGRIDPVPVTVGERTWPGVGVAVDEPAAACLAAQYAGWKLEHGDFFAMASGPGRALARAEDLFDELAWREQADRAVLCLETRQDPPAEIVEKVAERCGVAGVRGHVPDRAHRLGMRLGADLGPRGRDRAAQAARARRRPGPRAQRLGLLPDRAGGQGRPGRDRADQRRGAVRRHRASVDRGRGRRGRRAGAAAALVRLGRVRHAVRGAARGRRLELLRHRSDAVQPRRGHADQHGVRARAPRRRARARRARALVHVGEPGSASACWARRSPGTRAGCIARWPLAATRCSRSRATRLQSEVDEAGKCGCSGRTARPSTSSTC